MRKAPRKPDPDRRLLLGQIAEFLKRPQEALEWYRGVPGGPQRTEARLRTANVLFELGRKDEAFADRSRELQGDASADDDARRDAYLLEAELRQKDKDDAGELDALRARPGGLSRRQRAAVRARAWPGSVATASTAPRPTCARSWSPIRTTSPR